jgi:hypothetical protein
VTPRRPPLGLLAAFGVVQATILGFFLYLPLPTMGGSGAVLRRLFFLLGLIPGAIPDTKFGETLLGQTVANLSGLGHLPQRLPLVLAALLIGGAAAGIGRAVLMILREDKLGGRLETLALAYGLGATLLGGFTLIVGRFGLLDPWGLRVGLGALNLAHLAPLLKRGGVAGVERPWGLPAWAIAAGVPVVALMALGAMQPTVEFDALEYHLQGPKEHYQAGRIAFLPHNVYTSMPAVVEMGHLLGMVVVGDWYDGALVGQLLVAMFAPATAILVGGAAARLVSPKAGAAAALLYLTTPWVYRLATFPFVEGPLCFYHAALIVAALRAGTNPRTWGLAGLLAGGAMACKYPGAVSAVAPFGAIGLVVSIRGRDARPFLAYGAAATVAVGPWLVRNLLDTGNPVYPLAFDLFGGRGWTDALDAKWKAAHGPRPFSVGALATGLADIAGRSDWQSPLFVLFAPLAFLRASSRRRAAWLAVYVGYLFATWFTMTHRLDRFWLPLLPPLAVLAGVGVDGLEPVRRGWTAWAWGLIGLGTLANVALILTPLSGPTDWTADLRALRRDACAAANAPLGRLDESLAEGSLTLVVGQAGVFHVGHPILYNTVFNAERLESLAGGRTPAEFGGELARLGITGIYVDWSEIERHRKPGGYGFTDFVTPERFGGWVSDGVLGRPTRFSPNHEFYPVLTAGG